MKLADREQTSAPNSRTQSRKQTSKSRFTKMPKPDSVRTFLL